RRDKVVKWLNQARGIECDTPSGAFYVYADCKALLGKTSPAGTFLANDFDVASAILEEQNVATVPGSAFGLGPYLRIAYALDDDSLEEACRRIVTFCETLKS
ncbi:MAG: aminotransferase class I/II-fold pyridoxal phosphate-dependent enzyme, partial [Pseudomonadota bacterium]|nr:aminotransferase class I/II-fold pyridoxal phosphate-dependent enzyme [Pseudomonadota bacterium]